MIYVLWVWGPAVLLMMVIFVLSSLSDIPAPPGGLSDVSAHAIAYAGLGILMVRALAGARRSGVTVWSLVGGIALTTLYGVTDEYHQSFVDGRFSEGRDVMADAVGALSGAAAVWAWSIVFSTDKRLHDDV